MPIQPKLRRIVAPPGPPPPNVFTGETPIQVAHEAVRSHMAKADPSSCASDPPTPPNKNRMQFLTVHPSQPLVAYYMEDYSGSSAAAAASNTTTNYTAANATAGSAAAGSASSSSTTSNKPPPPVKLIQVQHLQTRNVLWTCYLSDLASMLFDYDPLADDAAAKFPHAMKTLGNLQSMQFFDPSTLYFTGMADSNHSSSSNSNSTASDASDSVERWQTLLVQFDTRILMLNLRKGPSHNALVPPGKGRAARNFYSPILCHLTKETGLNSPPSSNALPLTKSLLLLGCADGTFKCYDWKKSKLQKSIKGLGKNDWIVHLIAANRYPYNGTSSSSGAATGGVDGTASSSTSTKSLIHHNNNNDNNNNGNGDDNGDDTTTIKIRRFITVTKKGTAYLIEVLVGPDGIDIRPPLARFEGGASPTVLLGSETLDGGGVESSSSSSSSHHWEHRLLNYDADRDIFMWGCPSHNKSKRPQKVFCWDFCSLQRQFQAQKGGKSVYKPEPTLVIQFPFEAEVAAFPAWSHSAFPDDAIVCAVVTTKGDLHIMGATQTGTSGSATVLASPITSVNVRAVIQRDSGMVTGPLLQVHFIGCASLWDSGVLLLGSNLGVVMVDFEKEYVVPGARHNHFGAGLGSLGKSVLFVKHSSVVYGSVDAFRANPVGSMEIKNTYDVYESPAATHLPLEIQKRSFRLPPSFLPSPSGLYLCLFWSEEMRYEVLHVPSVLQRVAQRSNDGGASSAAVATGTGVSSFAWFGENDAFAIIHSPDAEKLGQATSVDAAIPTVAAEGKDFATMQKLKDLTDIRSLGSNLKDVKDLAVNTTKGATKVVTSTAKIATGAVSGVATGAVSGASKVHKSKVFSLSRLRGKKKNSESDNHDDDNDEKTVTPPPPMMQPGMYDPNANISKVKKAHVEFKELVLVETNQSTIAGSISPATATSLGELKLRGGNRIPPKVLFGGPVLCVGCRSEGEEGMAYFYTQKKDTTEIAASSYVSAGFTIPYPDLVVWDDDGKLCAVVIQSRVAVYLSNEPDFVLLGTVRVGSPTDPDGAAVSVKFLHGVLYCCTRNSIECVFLGDTSSGICHLDSLTIASTAVHTLPGRSILTAYSSLTPPTIPMPLNYPIVLGYQSGSLIVSTTRGLIAIPMSHPLLRIGTLLAAGQPVRATKWFDAVPESDHEELATFLERRGHPELAIDLPGLSLESMVDFAMRYGDVDRLEQIVESFGVPGLRSIDMGRGMSSNIFGPEEYGQSVTVCVGTYLLAHGKVELVRRLATECLKFGNAKKDAFVLATLMLNAEGTDARRVIGRAVHDTAEADGWAVASYVRNHIIPARGEKRS